MLAIGFIGREAFAEFVEAAESGRDHRVVGGERNGEVAKRRGESVVELSHGSFGVRGDERELRLERVD